MNNKMIRVMMSFAATAIFVVSSAAQSGTWQLDPAHSAVEFQVRHMLISNVKGSFEKMNVTMQYDPKDVSKTSLEATIDTNSVNTRVEGRDKDLRSANFFDVEKYTTITFRSKRVEQAGPGKMKLVGDMTMHGVTKEVVFDVDGPTQVVKDQRGNLHVGASASTKLNRRDFGLVYNSLLEGGGAVVGDEIAINLDVELVNRVAPPAAPEAARPN
jgi:polyisoprenoid-binding protein YceI